MPHPHRDCRRIALGAWMLLCVPGFVVGQTVTLETARAAARQSNPRVIAARAAVESAVGIERQAGAFPNPVAAYNREQTTHDDQTSAQDIVALEQRFDFFARSPRMDAARLRREAAENRLDAALAEVDFETARAWAESLAADRRAALADSASARFREAVRVTTERLSAGDVSGYEARRLKLEAARYAALAAEVHLARRSARLRLSELTRLPIDAALPPLTRPTTPVLALSADSAVALTSARAPEIMALRLEARAAEADARQVSARRLPDPAIVLGYKNERPPETSGAFTGFVAGLSVSLPLWNRSSGAIAAAAADAQRTIALADSRRLEVERQARAAHAAAAQADAQIAMLAAQLGVESEAAMRAATVAYAEGEIGLLAFLDTVRAYQEAESAFAGLLAETIIQRAALERLLGIALL